MELTYLRQKDVRSLLHRQNGQHLRQHELYSTATTPSVLSQQRKHGPRLYDYAKIWPCKSERKRRSLYLNLVLPH